MANTHTTSSLPKPNRNLVIPIPVPDFDRDAYLSDSSESSSDSSTSSRPLGLQPLDPSSPTSHGSLGGYLYHVFQKTYTPSSSTASSPRAQETTMRGTYPSREAAEQAAKTMLRWDEADGEFAAYEEYAGQRDWKYGGDVLVRAVDRQGEVKVLSVMREKWDVWF